MSAHRPNAAERYRQNFRVGLIISVITVVVVYLAFLGVPFKPGYDIKAVVSNANQIHGNSPVRIAGVNVGKVTKIERGPGTTAIVTMRIDKRGRPIHKDATLKIRPRLFLEGNFFIDMKPGTPSAPELDDDGTIPLSQTAIPVQFDQVLSTLQENPRASLKTLVKEYDTALKGGGAQAINRTFKPSEAALKGVALVSQESLGLSPHDLSQLVESVTKINVALAGRRQALGELLTNFNRTVAAFADNEADVATGTHQLGELAKVSYPALGAVNDALPPLRRFSVDVRPLLRTSPRTLDLTLPLLRQLDRLFSAGELPPLLRDTRPALRSLSALEPKLDSLLGKVTPVSKCVLNNALPVLTTPLNDGALSSGLKPWQELLTSNVGLASASQNFDGNGHHVRYMATAGENLVSVGKLPGGDELYTALGQPLLGSRPRQPDAKPPFRPDVPCESQDPPNMTAALTPAPTQTRVKPRKIPRDAGKRLLAKAVRQIAAQRKAAK